MGDSTTAGTPAFKSPREAPPTGSGDQTSQYAYWLMQAHADWEVVNQGINAQRSDVIAARFEADVIALKPAVVVIIAGVNDVYQGRPARHVKEQLSAMYKRAQDAGIRVVAGTIIPYNTATADQNARMREINEWIRAQAETDPRIVFVDTRAAVGGAGTARHAGQFPRRSSSGRRGIPQDGGRDRTSHPAGPGSISPLDRTPRRSPGACGATPTIPARAPAHRR